MPDSTSATKAGSDAEILDDDSTETPGRRELHKRRTTRALQQAALELFANKGFDETTTDEIADKAGVSPRTFFRYFPTKESVLFVGQYGWVQSLTRSFLAQPASRSDLDALHATLVAAGPKLAAARSSFVLYERAIMSSPILRGRVYDNVQADIVRLGDAIAQRRGLDEADESCGMLAALVLMLYRRALTRWVNGPTRVQPETVISDEFRLLLDQLAAMGPLDITNVVAG